MTETEYFDAVRQLPKRLTIKNVFHYPAQKEEGFMSDKLNVNTSDMFTKLIKDAARCNRFSSDIMFELDEINETLAEFDSDAEFYHLIGFRKDGVDHTAFVMSRCDYNPLNISEIYKNYFAFYSVEIRPDDTPDFYQLILTEYAV